ncbi:MAG: T9SS type A sorting domain-containing protein [Bacteroidales bacterium]|jgi:hypothetical protein|nr:T9SS type A sorting domain-containing protein [Bacteroidales bacterium]
MKKIKLSLFLAAVAAMLATVPVRGQSSFSVTNNTPFFEDFNEMANNVSPVGWAAKCITNPSLIPGWRVEMQSDNNRILAHNYGSGGRIDQISTPVLDISAVTGSVVLEFLHCEMDYLGKVDSLAVYYQLGETGEQVRIAGYRSATSSFQSAVIILPDAVKAADCRIIFEWISFGANGLRIDDVKVKYLPSDDAILTSFTKPSVTTFMDATGTDAVAVSVLNNGNNVLNNFTVSLELDGVFVATESVTNFNLAYNQTKSHAFAVTPDLSPDGEHTLRAWIDLAGDQVRDNDTVKKTFTSLSAIPVTLEKSFSEDFEKYQTGILPENWTSTPTTAGNTRSWKINADGAAGKGIYITAGSTNEDTTRLKLPWLDLSSTSYNSIMLEFDYKEPLKTGKCDTLSVYYMISGCEPVHLKTFGKGLSTFSHAKITIPDEAKTSKVAIIFEQHSAAAAGTYLDNILVRGLTLVEPSLVSFIKPASSLMNASDAEEIKVVVYNDGINVLNDFNIAVELDGASPVIQSVTEFGLASGETKELDLIKTIDLSTPKEYFLRVWIDAAGDARRSNDTISKTIKNYDCLSPVSTYPFIESFETELSPCWKDSSANTQNRAKLCRATGIAGGGAKDGLWVWQFSSSGGSVPEAQRRQYLISPFLSTDKAKTVSFYYKYFVATPMPNESITVGYSISDNLTKSFKWFTPASIEFGVAGDTGKWVRYTQDGIPSAAKYIAIRYIGNNNKELWVDSLVIDGTVPIKNDLAVTDIKFPSARNVNLTNAEHIQVSLTSYGEDTAKNYKIYLTVDGGAPVVETVSVPIATYGSVDYTFVNTVDLSSFGTRTLKAWAEIASDGNHSNDTAVKAIVNVDCNMTLPYFQSFENDHFLDCWKAMSIATGTGNATWNGSYGWGVFTNLKKEGNAAFRFAAYGGVGDLRQWLVSPKLPEDVIKSLSFYYAKTAVSLTSTLSVGYSTTSTDLSAFTWVDDAKHPTDDNTWYKYTNTAIPANAKYLAILFNAPGGADYTYIDDLVIEAAPTKNAAMKEIVSPDGIGINLTAAENITVVVQNAGTDPMTDFMLSYQVDGGAIISEAVSGVNITSKKQYTHTFAQKANLSVLGLHTIKAWIDLADDISQSNDTITKEMKSVACQITLPYVQNFEIADEMDCIKSVSSNAANADLLGRINGAAFTGSYLYRFSSDNTSENGQYKQFLIFPELPTGKVKNISFYYTHGSIEAKYDGSGYFGVGYSTTTSDTAAFTWFDDVTQSTLDWTLYTKTNIPDDAKYIAIRLNAVKGSNLLFVDSVVITGRNPVEKDLAVKSLIYPVAVNKNLSSTEYVKVVLENGGKNAVAAGSYKMYVSVNGGVPIVEDGSMPIPAYGSVNYTFTVPADLSAFGDNTLKIWAEIAGDGDNTNDTLTQTVNNLDCLISSFPYVLDFQDGSYDFLNCWSFLMADPTNPNISTIGLYYQSSTPGDTNWIFGFSSFIKVPSNNYSMYLISPKMVPTPENKTFSFKYLTSDAFYETVAVGYVTAGDKIVWIDTLKTNNNTAWITYTNNAIPGSASNVVLAYISTWKYFFFVDDLTVDGVLPVVDLRVKSFSGLPSKVELPAGEIVNIPIVINVKNDGNLLPANSAAFVYKVSKISEGTPEDVDYAYELYKNSLQADAELNYEFSDSISLGTAGTYRVQAWTELTDNFHADTIEAQIEVKTKSVRSEDFSSAINIRIYPNPTTGTFAVSSTAATTMEIIGANGTVLRRETVNGTAQFSLRNRGLYLLRFIDEKGRTAAKRLVVK